MPGRTRRAGAGVGRRPPAAGPPGRRRAADPGNRPGDPGGPRVSRPDRRRRPRGGGPVPPAPGGRRGRRRRHGDAGHGRAGHHRGPPASWTRGPASSPPAGSPRPAGRAPAAPRPPSCPSRSPTSKSSPSWQKSWGLDNLTGAAAACRLARHRLRAATRDGSCLRCWSSTTRSRSWTASGYLFPEGGGLRRHRAVGGRGRGAVRPARPTRSCWTSACPTCRAWSCSAGSTRSTPASRSSSSPATARPRRPSRRCGWGAYDYLVKPLDAGRVGRAGPAGLRHQPPDARAGRARWPTREPPPTTCGRRPGRRLPGHAGGVQGDRPGRPPGRDRPHHSARAAPARSWSPAPSTTTAAGPPARSWPSTARPSRRPCWRASCSATRRAPSPAPTASGSASSSSATAARCSSTRSAT